MITILMNIAWVIFCALVIMLPAGFYFVSSIQASWWHVALASLYSAIGMSAFAILAGLVALFIGRNRPQGGIKLALIATSLVGVFSCFLIISTGSRLQ